MSVTSNQLIENYLPVVKWGGLNTNKDVDFTGATNVKLPAGTVIGGSSVSALGVVTSASANALTAGRLGATTPAFNVDASTAVSVTGLNVKAGSTGQGVAVLAIGETNTLVTLDSAGTGTLGLNTLHTNSGLVTIGNTTSLAGALVNGPLNFKKKTSDLTGVSAAPTAAQSGTTFLLDKADGITVTLPVPVVGIFYDFLVITDITSNSYKIITDAGTTLLAGAILANKDNTANKSWVATVAGSFISVIQAAASTNATGGLGGSWLRFTCVSATLWTVTGMTVAGGTPTTPFSAT